MSRLRVLSIASIVATTIASLCGGVPVHAETATIINQGPKTAFVSVRYLTQKMETQSSGGSRIALYQLTQGWTKIDPNGGKATIEVGNSGEFYMHARDKGGLVIRFGTEKIEEMVNDEPFDTTRLVRETDRKGTREVTDNIEFVSGPDLDKRVPDNEDPAKYGWHVVTMYKLRTSTPVTLMAAGPESSATSTAAADKPAPTPASDKPASTSTSDKPASTSAAKPNNRPSTPNTPALATAVNTATTKPVKTSTSTKAATTRMVSTSTKPAEPSREQPALSGNAPATEPEAGPPQPKAITAAMLGADFPTPLAGCQGTVHVFKQKANKKTPMSDAVRWTFNSDSEIVEERATPGTSKMSRQVIGRFTEGRNCQQIHLFGQAEPFDYTLTNFTDGHIELQATGMTTDGNVTQLEGSLRQLMSAVSGIRVVK